LKFQKELKVAHAFATSSGMSQLPELPAWLSAVHENVILPRRRVIETHPFMLAMLAGSAEKRNAERYFSGLQWHLLDFGKHVGHLISKRSPEVERIIAGRSEDKDGNTDVLSRIVRAFGGPAELIEKTPWRYRPHPVWVHHDALLRAAIYSTDLPWQAGTAALTVGIESLVPFMIEPLFKASIEKYGVTNHQAAWLESRAGEEEKQHGENGYLILSQMVPAEDKEMQEKCTFFIEALSHSMAYGLLSSGLP
jgi:pyrroloquinoline quinone (PQQ) biosynthesis protein C